MACLSKIPTAADIRHNLELQLLPSSNPLSNTLESLNPPNSDENHATQLQLSIGSQSSSGGHQDRRNSPNEKKPIGDEPAPSSSVAGLKEEASEQLRLAIAEKAFADEARKQAKRQIELAEQEFSNAKKIRQHAQAELNKAQILKEHAKKQINATLLEITCHSCKQHFRATAPVPPDDNSLAMSYMSSAITEGEADNNDNINNRRQLITNT